MRILFVSYAHGIGNAEKYYLFPHRLINGFIRCGHNVFLFNDRDIKRCSNIFRTSRLGVGAMNRMLIRVCRDYLPDLIVLGHCESVRNETLLQIYEMLPEVQIVYRKVDSLIDPDTVNKIRRRCDVIDGVFPTTAGEVLNTCGTARTFVAFAPNPVDPSIDICPEFEIEGTRVVMSTPELAGVSRQVLGETVQTLAGRRGDIIEALDFLFAGV